MSLKEDKKGGSGIGKVLGSISPLYGAVTGRGLFGNALAGFQDATGMGGILPIIASEQRKKRRERRERLENEAPEAGEGMKRGGKAKAKKYAKGGMVKKAGGGAMQGPPASSASSAPRGDTYDENRLTNLNPPHSSRTTSDFSVRPAIKGGKPGIKVKGSFAKGGKVSSASKRADGCAKKGKTKGRFV